VFVSLRWNRIFCRKTFKGIRRKSKMEFLEKRRREYIWSNRRIIVSNVYRLVLTRRMALSVTEKVLSLLIIHGCVDEQGEQQVVLAGRSRPKKQRVWPVTVIRGYVIRGCRCLCAATCLLHRASCKIFPRLIVPLKRRKGEHESPLIP